MFSPITSCESVQNCQIKYDPITRACEGTACQFDNLKHSRTKSSHIENQEQTVETRARYYLRAHIHELLSNKMPRMRYGKLFGMS